MKAVKDLLLNSHDSSRAPPSSSESPQSKSSGLGPSFGGLTRSILYETYNFAVPHASSLFDTQCIVNMGLQMTRWEFGACPKP